MEDVAVSIQELPDRGLIEEFGIVLKLGADSLAALEKSHLQFEMCSEADIRERGNSQIAKLSRLQEGRLVEKIALRQGVPTTHPAHVQVFKKDLERHVRVTQRIEGDLTDPAQ